MRVHVALTRVEVLIVIVIIGLLLSILVLSLFLSRGLTRRQRCVKNVKDSGTGLYTIANESSDEWWRTDWRLPIGTERQTDPIEYTQAIGSYRSQDLSTRKLPPDRLSTTRGLWLLVKNGASPSQFICPSTQDAPNAEVNPQGSLDFGTGTINGPVSSDQAAQFWHQVSYGYQVPFGNFGQPSSDRDQHMILLADKGPFGASIDAGFPAPPAFPTRATPADWRPWNSPNHDGQGQTVLFADSHAEFIETPLTGFNSDNIYTRWSGETGDVLERSRGLPPAPGLKLVPVSNTDSLLYP